MDPAPDPDSLFPQAYSGEVVVETRDGRTVRFGNTPDIIPGDEDTYASYGVPWANVSNTPFRRRWQADRSPAYARGYRF